MILIYHIFSFFVNRLCFVLLKKMLYFLKYYYLIIFMFKNNKAFTFAELMVSVTIIAILSTISVIGLISYLESVRDVNRVWQIQSIWDWLDLYLSKWRNLEPEKPLYITYSWGILYSIQWYAWKSLMDKIKFSSDGIDPRTKNYFTISIWNNRKYFDVITYLENIENHPKKDELEVFTKNQDWKVPYLYWKRKVGILVDENLIPLNETMDSWEIDLSCDWSSSYKIIYENSDIFYPIKTQNKDKKYPCYFEWITTSCYSPKPTYTHARFFEWTPIYENQIWQQTWDTNIACSYQCKPWFSWSYCNDVSPWTWFCPTGSTDLTSNPNYSSWVFTWDIDCYWKWLITPDLSRFSSLTQVNWNFNLWANELTNISNLNDNLSVTWDFNLSSNNITSLWTLNGDFENIDLSYNDLTNLLGLSSSSITQIDISNNLLTDISSIFNKDIYNIYLQNNNISDISWLIFSNQFNEINISGNENISDLWVFDNITTGSAKNLFLDSKIYDIKINSNSRICTHWNVYNQNGQELDNKMSICNQ